MRTCYLCQQSVSFIKNTVKRQNVFVIKGKLQLKAAQENEALGKNSNFPSNLHGSVFVCNRTSFIH